MRLHHCLLHNHMSQAVIRSSLAGTNLPHGSGHSRLLPTLQVLPYSRQEELAGSGTLSGTSGGGSIGDGRRSYPAASSSGMVSGEDVALVVEVVLGPAAAWAAGLSPSPSSAQPSAAGGRAGAVGADAEIKVVADGIAAGELKAGRGSEEATQAEDVAGYWESQYDVDGFGQVGDKEDRACKHSTRKHTHKHSSASPEQPIPRCLGSSTLRHHLDPPCYATNPVAGVQQRPDQAGHGPVPESRAEHLVPPGTAHAAPRPGPPQPQHYTAACTWAARRR